MKKSLFRALAIFIVAMFVVVPVAFAWSGGIATNPDCEGVTVTANPPNYDGGLSKTWKPVQITGAGLFPWDEATHLEGTVTVKWAKVKVGDLTGHVYGYHTESFKWSADKPDCYQTCDETFEQVGELSDWTVKPDGSEVRSRVILYLDAQDQETVCKRLVQLETRNESLIVEGDCVGWIATHLVYKNGELVDTEVIAQGKWKLPYSLEEDSFYFNDEKIIVKEPANCKQCEPLVWMWLLFSESDTCAIRDRGYDGTYFAPGVPAQQKYCGCGWTTLKSWGGYVDSCNGWYDSDSTNLDSYYTYERFDIEVLKGELPTFSRSEEVCLVEDVQ